MNEKRIFHHERSTLFKCSIPEGNGPFPIVIFSHGYNGCMDDFDHEQELLMKNGIASCALTFSGGSTRDKSGYPTTSMTLVTEKEDLLSLIEWAWEQEEVDKNNIFLFGGSMGGLVSCLAANEAKDKIRAMMLLFPALCIVDDWNERFRDIRDIPDEMMFWNLLLGKNFFLSIRNMDVYDMLSKMAVNTLIFHGDKDPIVPLAYSEKAEKTLKNAKLIVFENEGHGFGQEAGKRMNEMMLAFLKEHL